MLKTKEDGITIVALVITIIIMLILLGVTVNISLSGKIFDKAKEAANKTQIEIDKEELLEAIVASMTDDGEIDGSKLESNLDGWSVEEEGEGDELYYTCVSPKENSFTVEPDGDISLNE